MTINVFVGLNNSQARQKSRLAFILIFRELSNNNIFYLEITEFKVSKQKQTNKYINKIKMCK